MIPTTSSRSETPVTAEAANAQVTLIRAPQVRPATPIPPRRTASPLPSVLHRGSAPQQMVLDLRWR